MPTHHAVVPNLKSASDGPAKGKDALPSLATMLQDEEAAAIDLGNDANAVKLNATGGSRWRTQLFALRLPAPGVLDGATGWKARAFQHAS